MSEYMPKVGDKVRATLGENVLVGEVLSTTGGEGFGSGLWLDITGLPKSDEVFVEHGVWTVEQVVSAPSKFGAVIRRADGQLFAFTARRQKSCPWLSPIDGWVSDRFATDGGFTILFDGIDE